MEELIFYIDDIRIAESPGGWEDLTTTIKLDWELKGIYTIIDVTLTFTEDGYDILNQGFLTYGHCHDHSLKIQQRDHTGQYIELFNGKIYQKDIEYTEGITGASAKANVTDNSFFSKIYNNRTLGCRPYVPRSKNDEAIAEAPFYQLDVFNPADGVYYGFNGSDRGNTCFLVYDVLRFITDFISDGTVEFQSTDFAAGGRYADYVITNGRVLRFAQLGLTQEQFEEDWPEITLSDVMKELDKEFDIGFVSGFNGNRPFFRVDGFDTLFPEEPLHEVNDIDRIKRKAASERLYAKIVTGSEITENEPTFLSFPEKIRFVGFNDEEYIITQNCNNDRTLDLRNSWIISSNVIEDLVVNGAGTTTGYEAPTAYDQTVALIHAREEYGSFKAVQTNWLGSGTAVFYNQTLNTNNKVLRHLKGIPAAIANYLGAANSGNFRAQLSTPYGASENITVLSNGIGVSDVNFLIPADDETTPPNTDITNVWDNVLFEFVAPSAGVYAFEFYFPIRYDTTQVNAFNWTDCNTEVSFIHYDSSSTLINGFSFTSAAQNQPIRLNSFRTMISQVIRGSQSINCNAGDIVRFNAHLNLSAVHFPQAAGSQVVNYIVPNSAYVACTSTADGGGVYQVFDPEDYPIMSNKFNAPLSVRDFKRISTNPIGLLSFSVNRGKVYKGWIEELRFKNIKGEADYTLISNQKIN